MVLASLFFTAVTGPAADVVKLPPPAFQGKMSVAEALKKRRTVRQFAHRELALAQVSQLLWGTDGVSGSRGLRTAPSAGATYPLEFYLLVGERGVRYTHMEIGHAGQNLFLQAEALGLACGIVGAFQDRTLKETLHLPREHEPLLIMPVGYSH